MKNLFGGLAVCIANIIPGVSGGTIMVLLGIFDNLMEAISNIFNFKIKIKDKKKDIIFLTQVLAGVAVGLVGFAKILEILFENFEVQTLYWFIGLIIFSIPVLKKKELKEEKINYIYLLLGIILIGSIAFLSPGDDGSTVSLNTLLDTNLTPIYIITLIFIGIISGASMMFPGVSGSMVLLVLGYYHIFKGYVANVTSFEIPILLALTFIAIGVGIGIVGSAIITNYLLHNHKRNTMSFILGLVIMSAIVIIPITTYTYSLIITSIISFIIGAAVVLIFEKYSN